MDNEYTDLYYTELKNAQRIEDTIEAELLRGSVGCDRTRSVSCAVGSIRSMSTAILGDRLKISGEIRFSGVACDVMSDESLGYSSLKIDVPFEKYVNFGCRYPENTRVECAAEVSDVCIELDASSVRPRAVVTTYLTLVEDKRITRLAASSVGTESFEQTCGRVHVVFPEPTDTLFEIAKRYHTTVSHVAALNSLTEECVAQKSTKESLAGIRRLIIK